MRISAINNQQNYNNNLNFQARRGNNVGGKKGVVLGGLAGLMMTGAMMATCPVDWKKIKTWPIVATALTTAGAYYGKFIEDLNKRK